MTAVSLVTAVAVGFVAGAGRVAVATTARNER